MARMKAEFMQGWNDNHGISYGDRFFAGAAKFYPLAATAPRLSNWILHQPAVKELLYQFFNIDRRRELPAFARETFMEWFKKRSNASLPTAAGAQDEVNNRNSAGEIRRTASPAVGRRVVLFIDLFTNFHDPQIGKAAVRFLEANGCRVIVPGFHELGRPQLSKGMLVEVKEIISKRLPVLAGYANQEIPIIGLEPSEILTLRDEYRDLCSNEQLGDAQAVSEQTFTLEEYAVKLFTDQDPDLSTEKERGKVFIHNHCHAEALSEDQFIVRALKLAGYNPQLLNIGCCGMAGSFGYEADHYDVSMKIGDLTLFPALEKLPEDALICAPGFSCRHQIKDGTNRIALHPAELLADAVR